MAIKIGILDDHPFIIKGISVVIEQETDMEILWSAAEERKAWEMLCLHPVDVFVTDLQLEATGGGLMVIDHVKSERPDTKIIVLSAHASPYLVRESAQRGAAGYFKKTDDLDEFIEGIRQTAEAHNEFLGPYRHWAKRNPQTGITPRERQVLIEMAKGRSNLEAAEKLGVGVATIKTHLESIYQKLNVSNRTDAVRVALSERYFYIDEI